MIATVEEVVVRISLTGSYTIICSLDTRKDGVSNDARAKWLGWCTAPLWDARALKLMRPRNELPDTNCADLMGCA